MEDQKIVHNGILKVCCELPLEKMESYSASKVKVEIFGFEIDIKISYEDAKVCTFAEWLERIEDYLATIRFDDNETILEHLKVSDLRYIEEICYGNGELYIRIEKYIQSFFVILNHPNMPDNLNEQLWNDLNVIFDVYDAKNVGSSYMNLGYENQFMCPRDKIVLCCNKIHGYLNGYREQHPELIDFYICIGSLNKDLIELDKLTKKCRGLYGREKIKLERANEKGNELAIKYAGPL